MIIPFAFQRHEQNQAFFQVISGDALTKEVRDQLASIPADEEITIDLPNQKIISSVGTFDFDIDGEWKHKLINGLDDIGITLQYEDLIAEYEKNRPSYWQ